MNEENILLNIEFNSDDIKANVKNIVDGRKQIDALIESNKKLAAQGEKNSAAYVQNELAIKALNVEVATNTKVVQANSQAVKANEDNLKSLKAENKQLLKDRDLINHKTAEGRAEIERINAKYEENSKIIADNSTKVEKQRFNIGNYSSALSGISPQLGAFSQNLGTAANATGGVTTGIFSMVKASLAFVATPLGAVIAALVAGFKLLQTFLTGSTKGMDLLEDASAAVGTILDIVTDRVVKFVGGIAKLISGDFTGGLDDIGNSFSGIGDEIEREIALTLELNEAIRNLEDAEIAFEISTSKSANTIKELLLQAKNRTLSEKERIKLLEEADALEAARVKQLIANRQEALRIANEEANKRVELTRLANETEEEFGKRLIATDLLLDDQRDKVKDAIIAFNNALGDGITVREKIQNQQDALAQKAEEDAKKRAEAEKKRLEDIAKKQEELRQREATAANELEILRLEKQAREIQGIENQTDKLIEVEQVRSEQLLANEELTASERERIIFESDERINEILINSREREALEQQAALEQSLADFQTYTQGLINAKKEELLQGLISQEEYNQEITDLELATLETQQLIKEQFGQEDIALQTRITDYKISLGQKELDAKEAQEKAKVDAVRNGLGIIASAFNKQSVAFKVLASVQTLITTYQSAIAAFNSLANIPYVGTVLGIAAAAAATANGLAAVAKINSTQVPKFAEGGMIDIEGKRHSQGGEKISIGGRAVAEVEGGEKLVVLKRGASPLLKKLGFINSMVGGVNFGSDQTPRRYLADGGFVARSAASRVQADFQIQGIAEAMSRVQIFTRLTDIQKAEGNQNRANIMSELS
jgi:hypothetical protein